MRRIGKRALLSGIISVLVSLCTVSAEEVRTDEGYREEADIWSSVVSWCQNGTNKIFGKFYFPSDYTDGEKYPVVICSHGLGSSSVMMERSGWPSYLAEHGYIAYVFDYCGGGYNSYSDLEYEDMSVLTEIQDLSSVVDFVKAQEFCDQQNLYLLGQSQGGLVSAIVGARRNEEIKGMILIYPAFCVFDNIYKLYPTEEDLPEEGPAEAGIGKIHLKYITDVYGMQVEEETSGFTGSVLIIHGLNDKTVPYEDSLNMLKTVYADSSSELYLVADPQAVHGFENLNEGLKLKALEAGRAFLDREQKWLE